MGEDVAEGALAFKVVVNDERSYSLWPAGRDNPLGWRDAAESGSRAGCLAHIDIA